MAGNKKNPDPEPDPRFEFLKSYTEKSLRLKHEKWPKMLSNDEFQGIINDFFKNADEPTLVFNVKDGGPLIPCLGYHKNAKTKSVYFARTKKVEITEDNYKTLTFGDVPPNPVETISVLLEIFTPLLSNPSNRWPACVAQDVTKQFHDFKSTVLEVQGRMIGKTILPLPLGIENVHDQAKIAQETNGRNVDLQFRSAIEGKIIKWSGLIEEAINADVLKIPPGTHPGPMAEIEFWSKRRGNLDQLYGQLMDEKVKNIATILETTKSAYFQTYQSFYTKVVKAVKEAREVTGYMNSFLPIISKYESAEFIASLEDLQAFVHCVCVMWSRSEYYSTGPRTLFFLTLFSNSVVLQCMKYVDPGSVFQNDPEETLVSIESCLEVLSKLEEFVTKCSRNIGEYFRQSRRPLKPFNFDVRAPFARMNKLIQRLNTIKDFMETSIDYLKLDRIIIGNMKGAVLCKQLNKIFEEFEVLQSSVFRAATYDPLEPDQQDFEIAYKKFQMKSKDYDLRLASIFSLAFDDASSLNGVCELIVIIGPLANRSLIRKELESKYSRVASLTMTELEAVMKVYQENMRKLEQTGRMPTTHHFPATAEIISWVSVLSQRVIQPMEWINLLEPMINKTVDFSLVKEMSKEMLLLLHKLEEKTVAKFFQKAVLEAELHLKKSIMTRHSSGLLALNFDPGLVGILKEMKYLNMFGPYELPPQLKSLFDRDDELFLWVQRLNDLVSCYNEIRLNSLPVEMALVLEEVQIVDQLVDMGIEVFDWNTSEAEKFISKTRLLVKRLHDRVDDAQQNANEIKELMYQWKDKPMFARPCAQLLNASDRSPRIASRYTEIREAGSMVYKLININYHLLQNLPLPEVEVVEPENEPEDGEDEQDGNRDDNLKGTDTDANNMTVAEAAAQDQPEPEWILKARDQEGRWRDYVEHIDRIVADGLTSAIHSSIRFLADETDPERTANTSPLFQIELELKDQEIVFHPHIDGNDDDGGFLLSIKDILKEIFHVGELVARVAPHKQLQDYKMEVDSNLDLVRMRKTIMDRTEGVMEEAREFSEQLMEYYSHLWQTNQEAVLEEYLKYSRALTAQDDEAFMVETPPTLDNFREEIDYYAALHDELQDKIPATKVFKKWLLVNCHPFKASLLSVIDDWGSLYKNHLYQSVLSSVDELEKMIIESESILSVPVPEDDYDALVRVMDVLYQIREKREQSDEEMFQPLWKTIELLKNYDETFKEEKIISLQELPDKWLNLKKQAGAARLTIRPLVDIQAKLVKERISEFNLRQLNFKQGVESSEIYRHSKDVERIYELINEKQEELVALDEEQQAIAKQAALFDVPFSA